MIEVWLYNYINNVSLYVMIDQGRSCKVQNQKFEDKANHKITQNNH